MNIPGCVHRVQSLPLECPQVVVSSLRSGLGQAVEWVDGLLKEGHRKVETQTPSPKESAIVSMKASGTGGAVAESPGMTPKQTSISPSSPVSTK